MSDPFMPADDRYGNEIIERLQARLTAAETRVKELEQTNLRIREWNANADIKIKVLRAELDKLKGKS